MDKLAGRKTLRVSSILDEFEKDRIKGTVDIVSLFTSFGVSLERKGKNYMGNCPWHEDGTPSLSVDREKGLYNCFGCGESGDAFTLVEKMRGCNFKGALEYLKGEGGRLPPLPSKPVVERPTDSVPSPIDTHRLLEEVAERYSRDLLSCPEAREYLASRGLDTPEVIEAFRVGYSKGELARSVSDEQKKVLTEAGIFTATGREHFGGCIVVPLLDAEARAVSFYGRRIGEGKPSHLYPAGEHRGIVNAAAAKVYPDSLILCESVLDALSLFTLGIKNVIPCYGTNGFTADHEGLLKEARVKEVVIAFDADEAGGRGALSLKDKLTSWGITVKTIEPREGKDWNEFLVAGGTREAVEGLIAQASAATKEGAEEEEPHGLVLTKEAGRHVFSRRGGQEPVRYRLTGVREGFQASLRVGVRLDSGQRSYVDTVDFYSSRSRASFAANASRVGLEASRVEADILEMLDSLEAERDARLSVDEEERRELTEAEKAEGLAFLSSSDLFERIDRDLSSLGYVGEEVNKLLIYLAASSRKLDDPLSVIVSSQSSAGKSYLIDSVKRLIPEEDVVSMTSLSDQALNYLSDDALSHKFLVMGEAVHSPSVEHQIREMLSAKELSRLVTVKDEKSGEMASRLVSRKVIVSLVMSTTREDMNPENASRCFLIASDESQAQTQAIHKKQRMKYSLENLETGEEVPAIIARHQAAQRLLRKIAVVNPYAHLVDFPSRLMRSRRDHARFLDLIACVCFLRQYQKEVKRNGARVEYVECDLDDYRIAHRLMSAILPLTLSSFPAAAEALYASIRTLIRDKAERNDLAVLDTEVTQREIREGTGLSQMVVKRNVRLLVEYEFLNATGFTTRGSRRGYRLVRDEDLFLVDLSSIPSPEELAAKLQNIQSGACGADWGRSGSDPLLRL